MNQGLGVAVAGSAPGLSRVSGRCEHADLEPQSKLEGGVVDVLIHSAGTQDIEVWYAEVRSSLTYRLTPEFERQVIYLPGEGRVIARTMQGEFVCDATRGFNLRSSEILAIDSHAGRKGLAFSVDRRAVARRLTLGGDGRLNGGNAFARQFTLPDGEQSRLVNFVQDLSGLMGGPNTPGGPRLSQATGETLIDLLIRTLPRLETPASEALPEYLARAQALLTDEEPILTVDQLALKCGVSVRALQYGFSRHIGVTPIEALRTARLEKVRSAIAREPWQPLLSIARRYGFTNLSRLRRAFRDAYGEAPLDYQRRLRRR